MRAARLTQLIFWSTALLLAAGLAAFVGWWMSGNPVWIRSFFYYPGTLFFLACSLLQTWLSLRCWRQFSRGDLLKPAWLLIAASGFCQLVAALLSHVLEVQTLGLDLNPLYMVFLGCGLLYVLRACRRSGILGRLKFIDLVLLAMVVFHTLNYYATVVLSPAHPEGPVTLSKAIGWLSDPLLCMLLFEAILLRRSTANVGLGLISRCWLSFTAAIFLTLLGDAGLWASARGYLPYGLEVASWYVWFVASACYALGPSYQLYAIERATREETLPSVAPFAEARP